MFDVVKAILRRLDSEAGKSSRLFYFSVHRHVEQKLSY